MNVFTGDEKGSGTDADVFLTIFGENGDSGENDLHCLQRGSLDSFCNLTSDN